MSTEACITLARANLDEKKVSPAFGITGARSFSMPWMSLPAPRFAGSRGATVRERAGVNLATRAGGWIRNG
jgi:hypothetical protein